MNKFCRIHSREVLNPDDPFKEAFYEEEKYKPPTMKANIKKGRR